MSTPTKVEGMTIFAGKNIDKDGYVTLTNTEGVAIQAKILGIDNDYVSLRRNDGQNFSAPISLFSDSDQAFLEKWKLKTWGKQNRMLRISAQKIMGNATSNNRLGVKVTGRSVHYELRIQNMTNIPLNRLSIYYHYHVTTTGNLDYGASINRPDIPDLSVSTPTKRISSLEPHGVIDYKVPPRTLSTTRAGKPNDYGPALGSDGREDLKGITVTIYNDGILIGSFADPSSLLDN